MCVRASLCGCVVCVCVSFCVRVPLAVPMRLLCVRACLSVRLRSVYVSLCVCVPLAVPMRLFYVRASLCTCVVCMFICVCAISCADESDLWSQAFRCDTPAP